MLVIWSTCSWGQTVERNDGVKALAWSSNAEGALFVETSSPKSKDALLYDSGDFSFRLSDPLYWNRESGVFSFWLGTAAGEVLIYLKSAGVAGGNGSGQRRFVVEDLGKLKLLKVSSGEGFLFTEIAGVWRCVSISDRGRKLLIDYDRNGLISRVRDNVRTLEPVYSGERMVSVYQTWPVAAGRQLALVRLF